MEEPNSSSFWDKPVDPRIFLNHPHDKYVRALLQYRISALEIIQYVLPSEVMDFIDVSTLQLTNASFIDEHLTTNLADVCYEGKTKTDEPFRVSLLFEHKSNQPGDDLYEQFLRYNSNIWIEDRKQNRPKTLTVPILIHHGSEPLEKITPRLLFPTAPDFLLRYVPLFDYELLDIATKSDEEIENMEFKALRNVFFALKYGRNEEYLRKNWRKVVIFASDLEFKKKYHFLIHITLVYMSNISPTVRESLEMRGLTLTPQEEKELVMPEFFQKIIDKGLKEGIERGMSEGLERGMSEGLERGMSEGLEKGMEKGMEKGISEGMLLLLQRYIIKNPTQSDEQIADLFEVDLTLVETARKSLQS
jgi:predicted transposase YdaD